MKAFFFGFLIQNDLALITCFYISNFQNYCFVVIISPNTKLVHIGTVGVKLRSMSTNQISIIDALFNFGDRFAFGFVLFPCLTGL